MTIHPEDVASYAGQLHSDLARVAEALERLTEQFSHYLEHEHFVNVKQVDTFIFKEELE